ncbi:MAG: alkaline phosphatase family protein [Acidobacteriota bacterium]
MQKKVMIAVPVTLGFLALAALHVQFQPSSTARVIRRGNRLSFLTGRVAFAPRYLGTSCLIALHDGRPEFARSFSVENHDGLTFPVDVSFDYKNATAMIGTWPDGTWCTALDRKVETVVRVWASSIASARILDDPRVAGVAASETLQASMRASGVQSEHAAVRVKVPAPLLALRRIPAISAKAGKSPPVIFIGLDGADWELLDGYMKSGLMPNLAQLVREGSGGVLLTQHPPLSPLVWNSMMSGRSPLDHEILDFTRFNPSTGSREPITSDERRVPAIWNMETWAGKSVVSMGLWATFPAEAVNGLLVSDRLFTFLYNESVPPPGVVFPPSREQWARKALEEVEQQTSYETLRSYMPWLTKSEYDERIASKDPYAHPVSALRRILVETGVYDRLAKSYLSEHRPDLTIVYFQGTDSIGHVFAPFSPPKQPEVSEEDYEKYHAVPERYFQHIDSMLGEYRKIAVASGARLMIASDHGFRWHEGRPTQFSSFAAATAAKWHREEGIFLLWGPGISARPGHTGRGEVIQVCATLLALTGLPPGTQITGPPLPGAQATGTAPVDYSAHYQRAETAPVPATSSAGNEEELAKLRSLGYIGSGESMAAAPGSVESGSTRTAGSYNNEGLILRNQKRTGEAIAAWDKAIQIDPNLASALWNLSDTLFAQDRDLDKSDALLVRGFAHGLPEGEKFLIGRAIGYQRSGKIDRSVELMNKAVAAEPDDPNVRMFRGRYLVEEHRCQEAMADFLAAQKLQPRNPAAYNSAILAALCLGDSGAAQRNLQQSLAINPDQPQLRAMVRKMGL